MAPRSKNPRTRRTPVQARSRQSVEYLLEAAARVFRREGFGATTNRIAHEAGVGIGTLYEYFPDKHALLLALARRHVEVAEEEVGRALEHGGHVEELLAALQQAIVASHRFPSQALELAGSASVEAGLRDRVERLRDAVLQSLTQRAGGLSDPDLRARAAFGAIGELTARTLYDLDDPQRHAALARYLLQMAVRCLRPEYGP